MRPRPRGCCSSSAPSWRARWCALPGGSPRLQAIGPGVTVQQVGTPRRPLLAAVRALRPQQWVKNALVFIPVIAAGLIREPTALAASSAAFAAFCLASSAVYVVNDLVDLADDRAHPSRRRRPFASGALPPTWGPPMAAVLLATAAPLATLALPTAFLAAMARGLTGWSGWRGPEPANAVGAWQRPEQSPAFPGRSACPFPCRCAIDEPIGRSPHDGAATDPRTRWGGGQFGTRCVRHGIRDRRGGSPPTRPAAGSFPIRSRRSSRPG